MKSKKLLKKGIHILLLASMLLPASLASSGYANEYWEPEEQIILENRYKTDALAAALAASEEFNQSLSNLPTPEASIATEALQENDGGFAVKIGDMTPEEFEKYALENGLGTAEGISGSTEVNGISYQPQNAHRLTPEEKERIKEQNKIKIEQAKNRIKALRETPSDRYIIKYKEKAADNSEDIKPSGGARGLKGAGAGIENARSRLKDKLGDKIKESKVLKSDKFKDGSLEIVIANEKTRPDDFIAQVKAADTNGDIEFIQPDFEISISAVDNTQEAQTAQESFPASEPAALASPAQEPVQTPEPTPAETTGPSPMQTIEPTTSETAEPSPVQTPESNAQTPEPSDTVIAVVNSEPSASSFDANFIPAWSQSQGQGVIVAVLDSSVDIYHQSLSANIFTNQYEANNGADDDGNGYVDDIHGYNFYNNSPDVFDANNISEAEHGTHVAGIIGAVESNGFSGVAPKVSILPIAVFKNGKAYTSDIIAGIEYAEKMGAKVVNCSWGGTDENEALRQAMERSSMLFVCAAGNNGRDLDNQPVYPAAYGLDNVISVASINGYGALSPFSNYGRNTVDVAAPGEDINSTLPNNAFGLKSGASVAAAYVSGEAALILGKFRDIAARDVKMRIKDSSDRLSSLINKVSDGNKINCANAMGDMVDGQGRSIIKVDVPQDREQSGSAGESMDWSLYSVKKGPMIASGDSHSVYLKADGTVLTWGQYYHGDLFIFSTIDWYSSPTQVEGLSSITAVAAGGYHSLALKSDGTVWAWGGNASGELGDGTYEDRQTPIQVKYADGKAVTGAVSVAAGEYASAVLLNDGTVWMWGGGWLGDWTYNGSAWPVQVTDGYGGYLSGVIAIAVGTYHSLALKNDGTVWAWGYNFYGQLGDGSYVDKPTPVQVSGLTGVKAIAAGYDYSIALKSDGTVWAWGGNGYGKLGIGDSTIEDSYLPVQVKDCGGTGFLTGIAAISTGPYHCMALKYDGSLYTWGYNGFGQLADETLTNKSLPVLVPDISEVSGIAAGYNHSEALKVDGSIWVAGDNGFYQFGDGSPLYSTTPKAALINNIQMISSSPCGHYLALKNDGTVWAWGYNWCGQLGDGTALSRAVPVQVTGLTGVIQVIAGDDFSLALKSDGTVWAWGGNWCGQLGDGTRENKTTPVQVSGLTDVKSISAGGQHVLALKNDGTVWAWGDNWYGQLGDGTNTSRYTPVQVSGLTGATQIVAGIYHSLALKSGGTVWAWGYNNYGQLGNGTNTSSSIPVQVTGLTGVTQIIAGNYYNSYAIKSDGTVWAWGYNNYGQLGDGTTANRCSPVQATGLSDVKDIAIGYNFCLALKNDGTVWAWGYNHYGQLGNGTTTNSPAPVQASGLTGITAVTAGSAHGMALKNDNSVWTWGANSSGQLGDGSTNGRSVPAQILGIGNVKALYTCNHSNYAVLNDNTLYTWGYDGYSQLGLGTHVPYSAAWVRVLNPISGTVTVSGGAYHTLVLNSDGTVWAAGGNSCGQLGTGDTVSRNTPVQLSAIRSIIDVSAGDAHSLALKNDGSVWAWGDNAYSQLGSGSSYGSSLPVRVMTDAGTPLTGIIAISAGYRHNLALDNHGCVWAWGAGGSGQLGIGSTNNSNVAVKIPGLANIKAIAAGYLHSAAIDGDGNLWVWGAGGSGQLGNGSRVDTNTPIRMSAINNVKSIALGWAYSVAADVSGDVWLWGDGVTTPARVNNDSFAPLTGVVSVCSGVGHKLALDSGGNVWVWGWNAYNQLGDGTTVSTGFAHMLTSLPNVRTIAIGNWSSFAIDDKGRVWAWGFNGGGQFGDGTYSSRAVPGQAFDQITYDEYGNDFGSAAQIQVNSQVSGIINSANDVDCFTFTAPSTGSFVISLAGAVSAELYNGSVEKMGSTDDTKYRLESGQIYYIKVSAAAAAQYCLKVLQYNGYIAENIIDNAKQMSCGREFIAFVKEDGTVWGVGSNTYGQLGMPTSTTYSAVPVRINTADNQLTNVVAVSAGYDHLLILKADGTVWAVGRNNGGQLGIGTTVDSSTPVRVGGAICNVKIKTISAYGYHNMALSYDGTVYAWGSNGFGEVGNNSKWNVYTPIRITLSNIVSIACGSYHSLAVDANGDLYTWGYNNYGQLGNGDINRANVLVPVNISANNPDIRDVSKVCAGLYFSIAVKKNGQVYGWGYNAMGNLGVGHPSAYDESDYQISPVKAILPEGVKVVDAAAGAYHTLLLADNGSVYSCGAGGSGQLGYTRTISSTPALAQISGVKAVSGGYYFSAVVKGDRALWAFGSNGRGQLGKEPLALLSTAVPQQIMDPAGAAVNVAVLFAPQNLQAEMERSSVTLTWDEVAGAAGYVVFRNGEPVGSVSDAATYTDSGLTSQVPYIYSVYAKDSRGMFSAPSLTGTVQLETDITSVTINCVQGKVYNVVIAGQNLRNLSGKEFTVLYDSSKLAIDDLCGVTFDKETKVSDTGIAPAGVRITAVGDGVIQFARDTALEAGKVWTGVINIVKFRAIVDNVTAEVKVES